MKRTAIALVLLGGCLASQSDDPPPPSDPHRLFVTDVYPMLEQKCGGCHGASIDPGIAFLPPTAEAGYDRITNDAALVGGFQADRAPLVRGHQTLKLTPEESAKLVQWLDAELATRGPAL